MKIQSVEARNGDYPKRFIFDNGNSRIVSNEKVHRLLVELLMKQNESNGK